MTKGSKSGIASGTSRSKVVVEEKVKRSRFRTRIGMDFENYELQSQADVDEYLARYGVCLS